jgi:hypothetical protein
VSNDNGSVTKRGNGGFSLLSIQLILQGSFLIFKNVLPYTDEIQIGLGVLAIIAGILILIGK